MKTNQEIDAMLSKFSKACDSMLDAIIGVPLLASKIAQCAISMRDNSNIKTQVEQEQFLISELKIMSNDIKSKGGFGCQSIDSYIETLENKQKAH